MQCSDLHFLAAILPPFCALVKIVAVVLRQKPHLPKTLNLCYNLLQEVNEVDDNTFRCYVYRESEGHYIADCLDLTLMGEGTTMDEAVADLREAALGYLEAVHDLGWEEDLIPRRAPSYRWVGFYKRLASHTLKAIFTRCFTGFLTYKISDPSQVVPSYSLT